MHQAASLIEETNPVWLVSTTRLARWTQPFNAWTGAGPVDPRSVRAAIKQHRDKEVRCHDTITDFNILNDPRYHIERIAHLYTHLDDTPLDIDVGCPSLGYHIPGEVMLLDGNHRLCAAILRKQAYVAVDYGGESNHFHHLFPEATERR